ncbi:MAG: DUF1292 domain-containing protein [Bacillota bacterium]|jgi:uncharacterized protein YrzB (UPF0473 family)
MTDHFEEFVILTDEDGNEYEFEIVDVIEVEDKRYAVLYPVDDAEDEGYVIMRFEVDEDGEEMFVDIEDDDEWQRVIDAWEALLEEEEEYEEEDEEDEADPQ